MHTFKQYFICKYNEQKVVLGIDETIEIDGIGSLLAKVDTGNEAYNVLHGIDIKDEGDSVTFTTAGNKQVTKIGRAHV